MGARWRLRPSLPFRRGACDFRVRPCFSLFIGPASVWCLPALAHRPGEGRSATDRSVGIRFPPAGLYQAQVTSEKMHFKYNLRRLVAPCLFRGAGSLRKRLAVPGPGPASSSGGIASPDLRRTARRAEPVANLPGAEGRACLTTVWCAGDGFGPLRPVPTVRRWVASISDANPRLSRAPGPGRGRPSDPPRLRCRPRVAPGCR